MRTTRSYAGSVPRYLVKKVVIDWRAHRETGTLSAKLVSFNEKYPPVRVELSATSGVRLVAALAAAVAWVEAVEGA